MKQKSVIICILATTALSLGAEAQQAVSSAGGNAVGAAGSVSYTVGQPFAASCGVSLNEGVQQAYSISEMAIDGAALLDITTRIYPNPTTDEVVVQVLSSDDSQKLRYELYAVGGTLIRQGCVDEGTLRLSLAGCPAGIYVLRLSDVDASRSYHIVKNQ